jgi:uncharacterized repeat protein (TIGR03943 family)
MTTRTQSFVLLLFGGALLRLGTTDALLRFVRPVMRIYVLLAGVVFVGLAICGLLASARNHDAVEVDDHGHGAASKAGWLLLAPVIAILVIAPPALGSYSAARVPATVTKPASSQFAPLPGHDPVTVSMIDYAARAVWDDGRTLTGRTMQLTGFVLRTSAGGFVLSRLVITCCAADARPIEVGVTASGAAPPADTWVTVTGTYGGVIDNDTLPVIDATKVSAISEPSNPYDD